MTYKSFLLYLTLGVALMLSATSCNKDDDDDDTVTYIYSTSTTSGLVTSFKLKANSNVMAHLDSVFFTIDPERHVIYNADSLPVGTNVTALLPTLEFNTGVSKAVLQDITSGEEVTYVTNMTDSINFKHLISLVVTPADPTAPTMTYSVKVNVHQVEPDSIVWSRNKQSTLPGAVDDLEQRFATLNGQLLCFRVTNDQQMRLATADSPDGPWTDEAFLPDEDPSVGFNPNLQSLTSTGSQLYCLDINGRLYTSADGRQWNDTGVRWQTMIGAYENTVLGIANIDGKLYHDVYPQPDGFELTAIDPKFPITLATDMVLATNTWALAPQGVIVGGITSTGDFTNAAWGYDGKRWAVISGQNNALPRLARATMFSYYSATINSTTLKSTLHPTWYVVGGVLADHTMNRDTYISTDQGISWTKAGNMLQIPESMPSLQFVQAFVYSTTMTTTAPRAPRRISQAITQWDCPWVYLFGSFGESDQMQYTGWKGVLNRLTFKPLY